MIKNDIPLFATREDLCALLRAVYSVRRLQFVLGGLFDEMPDVTPQDLLHIEDRLPDAAGGRLDLTYLLFARDTPIEIRHIAQRRGGVKYAVDQLINPRTIVLRPGGQFGPDCIVAGQIGTAPDNHESLDLFRVIADRVKDQFTKIKTFYVGGNASELLDQGWRLTANEMSLPLYDLRRH